tara:strand:- start:1403 stop:2299 length:897 start_codon:yes stop_codon:yes gene_type:complete
MNKVCGVDEAGRGPLAGPVVAAAVILPTNHNLEDIKDSKKISPKKRNNIYNDIIDIADVSIGVVSHRTIDKINVLNATYLAMEKAIAGLDNTPKISLIDGYALPNKDIKSEGIIGGDDQVECISAASIIAKVTRDSIMKKIDPIFPIFKFREHKGYGTKYHMNTLAVEKATPIHRKSFTPVKNNLPSSAIFKDAKKAKKISLELVALHYFNNGFNIIEINKKYNDNITFDIIAEKNNGIIIINVRELNNYPSSIELKQIKSAINEQMIEHINDSEVCLHIANIGLSKNPIIEINNYII